MQLPIQRRLQNRTNLAVRKSVSLLSRRPKNSPWPHDGYGYTSPEQSARHGTRKLRCSHQDYQNANHNAPNVIYSTRQPNLLACSSTSGMNCPFHRSKAHLLACSSRSGINRPFFSTKPTFINQTVICFVTSWPTSKYQFLTSSKSPITR